MLGKYSANCINDKLVLSFSKQWLQLNNGEPIVFDAKLENGNLILCAPLARLQRTKRSDTVGM